MIGSHKRSAQSVGAARQPGLQFAPAADSLSTAALRARTVAADIGPRPTGGARVWPAEAVQALGEAGLLGISSPVETGGKGESICSFAQIIEELTATRTILGFHMESSAFITSLLGEFADSEVVGEYLPKIFAGEIVSSHATTEPAGGSSMSSMNTVAERHGSDWLISGRKAMAALAQEAALILATARSEKGPCVFILPADQAGVTVGPRYEHAGLAELPLNPITFDRVRIPGRNLLGEEGRGARVFVGELARTGRTGQAAMFVGLARAALEAGYRLATRRVLSSRPFQPDPRDVPLALLDRNLEAARALIVAAALQADSGATNNTALRLASSAKWFASDVAREVCLKVIELQGAWGTLPERGVGEILSDLLDLLPGGGANDVMAETIIRTRLRKIERGS